MTAVDEGIKLAQHLPKGTIHRDMADEIVKLRAQLAGVREKAEKLERYIPVEGYFAGRAEMEKCDWGGWCYFDDVLAALGGDA